jgi:small-conductance mechanosensitive channel
LIIFFRAILLAFILLHVSVYAAETTSDVKKESVEKESEKEAAPPAFIEVSDIPENAVKTLETLKEIKSTLAINDKYMEVHESLPSYAKSIDDLLKYPVYEDLEHEDIRTLDKLKAQWAVYLKQLKEWETIYKQYIDLYDDNRKILQELSKLWAQTHINASQKNAPKAIQDHIASVIIAIEKLRSHAKEYYDAILTDSNVVTTKILLIKETVEKINEVEVMLTNRVFYQNKPPYFDLLKTESFSPVKYFKSIYDVTLEKFQEVRIYIQTNSTKFFNLLFWAMIDGLFVFYFYYLQRKGKLFVRRESLYKRKFFFIKRPFSTFFILIILANNIIFPEVPKSVMEFQLLVILLPIFRILRTVVPNEAIKHFNIYFMLYLSYLILRNATGSELDERTVSIIFSLSLAIFIFFLIRHRVLEYFSRDTFLKLIYYFLNFLMILLFISVFANLYGAVQMSSRITAGVMVVFHSSLIFYTLNLVLTGYVVILFRRRISTASHIKEKFTKHIENAIKWMIKGGMLLWWFLVVTKVVGIYGYIVEFIDETLALSWTISTVTISVQSIFDFIIIVVGTWVIVKIVNTLLEVEVFARYTFPRGIPTVISRTLNYIIIFSGSLIALSSLGITSSQFAIVFGALGVGIGFGLRNIIANFISGIIMVYERPIQIGDTIEINNTMGKVLGIGTRSSTIKTFDGSEVIIPNADFIAKDITNWTLSDERRRKTIVFKVDFDSDIDLVLDIMKNIAVKNENVLKDPEPEAAFLGFGEYYLEFKLYFWLTDNLISAPSNIAKEIYRELKRNGVKMPLPKHKLLKED